MTRHSWVLWALCCAGVCSASQTSAAEVAPQAEFSVVRREPVSLVFYAPTKRLAGEVNRNRVAGFIDDALAGNTDLRVVLVDDQTVHDCVEGTSPTPKGRMTCLVEAVRSDYEPFGRNGRLRSWAEVREARDARSTETLAHRFMIVVAATRASAETNRVVTFLVDTDHALEFGIHAARSRGEYTDEHLDELEAYIVEHAVRAQSEPVTVSSEAEVKAYLEGFFGSDRRLLEALRRSRHWWAFGGVEFVTDVEAVNILVNDRPTGITLRGRNRLVRIAPGPHRLSFEHPDYLPLSMTVEIEANRIASIDVPLLRRPNVAARVGRQATFWTGLTLTLGGTAFALAQLGRGTPKTVVCFHGPGGDPACGGSPEWRAFGPPSDPTAWQSPNGRGVLLAPLGLGLAAGGLVMASGTYLIGEEDDFPWVQIIAGTSSVMVTYLVSALLNGQNAVRRAAYPPQ